jgi:hypothetical protein
MPPYPISNRENLSDSPALIEFAPLAVPVLKVMKLNGEYSAAILNADGKPISL